MAVLEEETDYLCNILVVGRKDWIVLRIENLSDEKTTSDAEPSDLVREASVSVGASLCIVGTNISILIPHPRGYLHNHSYFGYHHNHLQRCYIY